MESAVKMRSVTIGGREIKLAYTLDAYIEMSETIEGFDMGDIKKAVTNPKRMVDILFIMANNAAKLNGTPLDFDREWLRLHIPVSTRKFVSLQLAIIHTVTDGMEMETELSAEEDQEVDLVLRELQKKRTD